MVHKIKLILELTKIYLITNCYGNPNKVYIGKTINCRKYRHKQQFGSQITYNVIDEINSLDSKDWKPLECYWIEQFRQWGFDLQNKNKGGGGSSFFTQVSKNKISKNRTGKGYNNTSRNKGRIISIEENKKRSNSLLGNIKSKKTKLKISTTRLKRGCNKKPIIQFDMDGNFIKSWESTTDAVNFTKIQGIGRVLSNKAKHAKIAGGFIWKFKK